MATSVVVAVENELSCPICYEDFEEPKCLPSCAHNVCQQCLERMAKKKKKVIECPVCRVKSFIPKGGVAAFPKNHLLIRLLENTGLKERKALTQALENCETKIKGTKEDLKKTKDFVATAKSQAEEAKQKIKSLAHKVVLMVRLQERAMIHKIDQTLGENLNEETFAVHELNTLKLCDSAMSCIEATQEVLQSETVNFKDSGEELVQKLNSFSSALDTRMSWAKCEFKQIFEVSLTDTDSLEKISKGKSLIGTLNITTAVPVTQRLLKYSRSGSMIQIIDCLSPETGRFNPFSVAVSKFNGHFVVLDIGEEMNHVYILNEKGEVLHQFPIKEDDPWDVVLLKDDEIVVLDRKFNSLSQYKLNPMGIMSIKRKSLTAPPKNVRFSSLSVDFRGHFIISSCPCYDETDTVPCIVIYNPSGKIVSLVGEGILSTPEKAVSLNNKYFVADSSQQSVVVFNKCGHVLNQIRNSQLAIPSSIAVDYCKQQILIGDSGNSTIQIYNQRGEKQCWFQTEHAPIGVAFTKDCINILICFRC